MESESIVDYLKSSLGKPWPLIANLDPNLSKATTTTTKSPNCVPLLKNHNTITSSSSPTTPPQSNNTIAIPPSITNGKDHTISASPTPIASSSSHKTPPPVPQPPSKQLNRPPLSHSPISADNHSDNNSNSSSGGSYNDMISNRFNGNHTATQFDGLYPEWDEFYLLVCDICGIIIRPQALEKHLATKHRINVQQQNHKQSLPINRKTSTTNSIAIPNNTNDIKNHSTSSFSSSLGTPVDSSTIRTNNNDNCGSSGGGGGNSTSRDAKASSNSSLAAAPTTITTITKTPITPKLPHTNSSSSNTNNLSNNLKFIANPANKKGAHVSASLNNNSDNLNNRRNIKTVVGTINNSKQANYTNATNNFVKPTQNGITTTTTTATATKISITTTSTGATASAQQIPSKLWGGKHALDSKPEPAIKRRPCDWMKVRRAPDANPETLSSFLTRAGPIVDVTPIVGQTVGGLLHYEQELDGHASVSPTFSTLAGPTTMTTSLSRGGPRPSKSNKKTKAPSNHNNSCNNVNSNNHSQSSSSLSSNGFFDPTFYGLEPLSPTTTTSSSSSSSSSTTTGPPSSSSLSSTSSLSPSRATSLRYQDRKWRTTFNVLKDAFF